MKKIFTLVVLCAAVAFCQVDVTSVSGIVTMVHSYEFQQHADRFGQSAELQIATTRAETLGAGDEQSQARTIQVGKAAQIENERGCFIRKRSNLLL